MNATGNFKPGDITPAKLQGLKEPRTRATKIIEAAPETKMPVNEFFELLQAEQKGLSDGTKS